MGPQAKSFCVAHLRGSFLGVSCQELQIWPIYQNQFIYLYWFSKLFPGHGLFAPPLKNILVGFEFLRCTSAKMDLEIVEKLCIESIIFIIFNINRSFLVILFPFLLVIHYNFELCIRFCLDLPFIILWIAIWGVQTSINIFDWICVGPRFQYI